MNLDAATKFGETAGKNPGLAASVLLAFVGWPFLRAWVVMLGLGILHTVVPVVPALGYWAVYVLMLSLGMVLHLLRKPRRSK